MREFLYFVASLAGAAMLTALAVLYAPELHLWGIVLYISAGILALCAIGLLVDMIRRSARLIGIERAGWQFLIGAMVCASIFDAWFFWAVYSQAVALPPKQDVAQKPPPPTVKEPPQAAPWVSREEIEAQRKLGHELLIHSPEELISLEASDENIQIFLTKWIKLNYPIAIVPFPMTVQKKEYYVVEMLVSAHSFLSVGGIAAYFDPQKSGERLRTLHKGDVLVAFCQLQRIERSAPFNAYGMRHDTMHAFNCELP